MSERRVRTLETPAEIVCDPTKKYLPSSNQNQLAENSFVWA